KPANGLPAPPVFRPTALRRGVRVFIALAVAAAVVVMVLTVNRDTLAGLARIRWYWLVLTGLLWIVATCSDGARLAVLSAAGEHRLGIRRSCEVILVGYFMAAITPFQVGGLPLQLYSMNKWGISPGKASAVLLARGILFYGLVFLSAPFIAGFLGVSSLLLRILTAYVGVIIAVGAALIILGLAFPRVLRRWQERAGKENHPGRLRRLLARGLAEAEHFLAGLRLFLSGHNLKLLAAATGLTLVYGVAFFGMSASLLAGLGVLEAGNTFRVVGINTLLTTVLLFVPTPGASGVAEAGAAGLYSMLCPRHMLGVFVVLWRLFSFYIGAIIGGLVALKHTTR
ncbi:MAG: lysylphosphatidylglycerol synthase transmembrane domain-containing protein, partial [candidate division WOR-3 bacterium]